MIFELLPQPHLWFGGLLGQLVRRVFNVGDIHGVFHVILFLLIELRVAVVLESSQRLKDVLVDFVHDVLEVLIAQLIEE